MNSYFIIEAMLSAVIILIFIYKLREQMFRNICWRSYRFSIQFLPRECLLRELMLELRRYLLCINMNSILLIEKREC